ncbi:SAGA-associated factor 29 isoform X2 [Vicugna pacos]|uniref:SAGA-associated factor 29 isoform X2 n=1 Tax=Vicugna pacos TaxID=30538 RepID=A0ABM5BRD9_VICPA
MAGAEGRGSPFPGLAEAALEGRCARALDWERRGAGREGPCSPSVRSARAPTSRPRVGSSRTRILMRRPSEAPPYTMALVSADSRIAELLTELHQLIKQTQEERSRSEHNLVNIQKTHERMQTENKISPYYRTKLRGLYTTAKADAEAECNILRKALDKIAEIKSLLEERRIAAKIAGLYNDSEPPRKTMRRGVLMTLLQQSAMTLPLWIGKPGDKPPPLCGAIPASGDYVAKPGDKVAARVKAVDGDEQWILAEVVSYSHATNKYEVDDIDEEGKERHTLSRRRIIPLPQWKANPETDPEALFQKEQLVLALYPQTTCFYRALIHTPPQRTPPMQMVTPLPSMWLSGTWWLVKSPRKSEEGYRFAIS